jgi:hypothetical protein
MPKKTEAFKNVNSPDKAESHYAQPTGTESEEFPETFFPI